MKTQAPHHFVFHSRAIAAGLLCFSLSSQAETPRELAEVTVLSTAEEAGKQSLGVSVITKEDLEQRPVSNDISEIVRTMPGVNLTGNSGTGQRGNNRQIDLRGMGPENTLILIDGKPATSRNAVRMGWRGERDTRGDSNWVPAEQIERIEVIRGPAAARYGSGAMGGVVNIITKKAGDKLGGQISVYADAPQHGEEGNTRRGNFTLSGPAGENFSFRINGNANNTAADGRYINDGHQASAFSAAVPAGREGVTNRDLNGQISWRLLPGHTVDFDWGYSRQGNIYAGDTQNGGSYTTATAEAMYGKETNIMERHVAALTHKGRYDFGASTSYLQYITTDNTRLGEGLVGAPEGTINSNSYTTSQLQDLTAHTEFNLPQQFWGFNQMLTVGAEYARQSLYDPSSVSLATTYLGGISGVSSTGRSGDAQTHIGSLFVEDNIELTSSTVLTPALRLDGHSEAGANWSPALNLTQEITPTITLKGGIARAYKAPNLYQSNSNYVLYSSGNGCAGSSGCYLIGNTDLEAETSTNKELGVQYQHDAEQVSLTWFHNDYRNKIQAGTTAVATTSGGGSVYQWTNVPEAVSQGLEGNYRRNLSSTLNWSNNFTYMIEHKNKTNGDYLSVIPEYTINTSLEWRGIPQWVLQSTVTFYGVQRAMKYDYKGNEVSGTSSESVAPYNLVGFSGKYQVNKDLHMTVGVKNLFDIRHWRAGNSVGAGATANYGAGANTYNESGRTLYVAATQTF